ncbi:biliverdin-producing heme oxygenase [uncultured Roseobacter sp.]|uniref:biliverdin-producing heme oxygenase n=1 Tax=uncultured Roseobacter sp. TaxID=114847 RepID=UPI002623CCE0|nr:biliverdin-producing heme oxygenase [uncultured Roseobacter sp.]
MAHEALHDHPVFAALLRHDLSEQSYFDAIEVFFHLFSGAEERRMQSGLFGQFHLRRQTSALRADIGCRRSERPGSHFCIPDHHGAPFLLGVLYVCHGSGFGGNVIARRTSLFLPGVPAAFFGLPVRADTWRQMATEMEAFGRKEADRSHLLDGALYAFNWVTSFADRVAAGRGDPSRDLTMRRQTQEISDSHKPGVET